MFESLFGGNLKSTMVTADRALSGRPESPMVIPPRHAVLPTTLTGPFDPTAHTIYLGLGCFWGAEKEFWQTPGVISTAVGYQGGFTPHPTYEEVCSARTGHTEVVKVVYDPATISDAEILQKFWESHDPTQGFRQGNDTGTQYRSAVYYTTEEQRNLAASTLASFQGSLAQRGFGAITTEIRPVDSSIGSEVASEVDPSSGSEQGPAGPFYYAEAVHQQYLEKNPNGYCPITSTGVACQIPG